LADKWIVLKFGGTSVAGRPQWEAIAALAQARRDAGFRVLLVCSAVAGVTNRLSELADHPAAPGAVAGIVERHRDLASALRVDADATLAEAARSLQNAFEAMANEPGPRNRARLLALGEWLSTRIGALYLGQRMETAWVDAREALEIETEADLSPARRWLSAGCLPGADPALSSRWAQLSPVLVTQGFVGRAGDGATALLGRGGSDTSAALLAGRLAAECVEIWTDVPGLFSADPRLIPEARLLSEVDYEEALEMAASGARVVHPRSIRAAAETRTPMLIRDTGRSGLVGTRISDARSNGSGVKAVTCQHHMAVLLLENLDARRQVGFLAGVFDVFRRRGVSIDLVATSETTTTVSLNREANHLDGVELKRLAADLKSLCRVTLYDDCVCVNLVGRGARTALARLSGVMAHFNDHALLMASQSANDLCLSLLVPAGDHEPLLRGAHEALIPPGIEPLGPFGPGWAALRDQA
jgi:diaminopimelate decarboxylase/aspartate kinase